MADTAMTEALGLLRQAGLRVSDGNLNEATLVLPDKTARAVRFRAGPAHTLKVPSPAPGGREPADVRVTATASAATLTSAIGERRSIIVLDPPTVVIDGDVLLGALPSDWQDAPNRRRGRPAWGRWAVMRVLVLAKHPVDQQELATATTQSQQAVSHTLKALGDLVDHTPGGYVARNKSQLLDQWLNEYPGPGGATTYWYGLDSPRNQARQAADLAQELDTCPLVSGDVAADDIAPWKLPTLADLYVHEMVDFVPVGFSPSEKNSATLAVTVPADPTLWPVAAWCREGAKAVDALIVLHDLLSSTAPDAQDAAGHLKRVLMFKGAQTADHDVF